MASIGKKLSEARKEKGLSVEDVAHSTHIHANILNRIEEDDFSNFASTGYAKSFLKQYGQHLDVDVSAAIAGLDRGTANVIGSPKIDSMVVSVKQQRDRSNNIRPVKTRRPRRPRVEKPGGAPVFLSFILVVLIISISVFYFLGYRANSPEEFQNELEKNIAKTGLLSEPSSDSNAAGSDAMKSTIERNPLNTNQPDANQPDEPDPAAKLPEKPIIRAIPVPEPPPDYPSINRN